MIESMYRLKYSLSWQAMSREVLSANTIVAEGCRDRHHHPCQPQASIPVLSTSGPSSSNIRSRLWSCSPLSASARVVTTHVCVNSRCSSRSCQPRDRHPPTPSQGMRSCSSLKASVPTPHQAHSSPRRKPCSARRTLCQVHFAFPHGRTPNRE